MTTPVRSSYDSLCQVQNFTWFVYYFPSFYYYLVPLFSDVPASYFRSYLVLPHWSSRLVFFAIYFVCSKHCLCTCLLPTVEAVTELMCNGKSMGTCALLLVQFCHPRFWSTHSRVTHHTFRGEVFNLLHTLPQHADDQIIMTQLNEENKILDPENKIRTIEILRYYKILYAYNTSILYYT